MIPTRSAPILLLLTACSAGAPPADAPPPPPPPPPFATPSPTAARPAPAASSSQTASAEPPTATPTAAAAAPPSDAEQQARTDFAVAFVRAVAKRDRAAMASYLSEKEFCKAIIDAKNNPAKAPPKGEQACVELMTSQNQEALREVTKVVPQGFEPGSTEVMPVAPEKGIWMVLVRPKGFDPHAPDADKQGVMVTVLELAGKRFVVFPRKVEGKKSPAPKK